MSSELAGRKSSGMRGPSQRNPTGNPAHSAADDTAPQWRVSPVRVNTSRVAWYAEKRSINSRRSHARSVAGRTSHVSTCLGEEQKAASWAAPSSDNGPNPGPSTIARPPGSRFKSRLARCSARRASSKGAPSTAAYERNVCDAVRRPGSNAINLGSNPLAVASAVSCMATVVFPAPGGPMRTMPDWPGCVANFGSH